MKIIFLRVQKIRKYPSPSSVKRLRLCNVDITSAVKCRNSRYSGLTMVRAVDVPGVAAFNCHFNIT